MNPNHLESESLTGVPLARRFVGFFAPPARTASFAEVVAATWNANQTNPPIDTPTTTEKRETHT